MKNTQLPDHLEAAGSTDVFDETTLPAALQRRHELAAGRWAVLHLLDGQVWFVDLGADEEHRITAPEEWTITPQTPHMLRLDGPLRCRIDFYRQTTSET